MSIQDLSATNIPDDDLPVFEEIIVNASANDNIPDDIPEDVVVDSPPAVIAKPTDKFDREEMELQNQLKLDAIQERFIESQSQIQAQNQRIQELQNQLQSSAVTPLLADKKAQLEKAKQDYVAARSTFNAQAEVEAMDRFGRLQQEVIALESNPQRQGQFVNPAQSQVQSQPQTVQPVNPDKSYNKLKQFVAQPENAWMNEAFSRDLIPVNAEGVSANQIFNELINKGGHPATDSFWNLYAYELKKRIPAKYAQHYGKKSPQLGGGGTTAAPVNKKQTNLTKEQNMIADAIVASNGGDIKKKTRIAKMMTGNIPHGQGNMMFEIGA